MRSFCLLVALLAHTVAAQKALITFQAARNEKLAVYFGKPSQNHLTPVAPHFLFDSAPLLELSVQCCTNDAFDI